MLLKVIAPPPVVSTVPDELFRMTGTGNSKGVFAVVMFAPRKIEPVEEKLTALETRALGMLILPAVSDSEANSAALAVPMEESVKGPVPALMVTVRKFPVTASKGESVMAPPAELIERFVPDERDIAVEENVMGILELVKVVREPAVKFTAGAV